MKKILIILCLICSSAYAEDAKDYQIIGISYKIKKHLSYNYKSFFDASSIEKIDAKNCKEAIHIEVEDVLRSVRMDPNYVNYAVADHEHGIGGHVSRGVFRLICLPVSRLSEFGISTDTKQIDKDKFFATLKPYGLKPTIDLNKKNWDKDIFIFPLDRANE